jgi:hypothetical protein
LGAEYMSDMTYCQDAPYNKSLHPPPDASVTALAFATAAPDAGASELKRYTPPKHFLDAGPRTLT